MESQLKVLYSCGALLDCALRSFLQPVRLLQSWYTVRLFRRSPLQIKPEYDYLSVLVIQNFHWLKTSSVTIYHLLFGQQCFSYVACTRPQNHTLLIFSHFSASLNFQFSLHKQFDRRIGYSLHYVETYINQSESHDPRSLIRLSPTSCTIHHLLGAKRLFKPVKKSINTTFGFICCLVPFS